MHDKIVLIINHGGFMDMTRDEPQYVGGVIDMTLVSDDHCSFFEIAGIAKEDLKYKSVEKIWYLTPGESMATGLHEILSDVDVVYGLLVDAAKGEIHIFLEATKSVDGVGDNENGEKCGWRVYASWHGKKEAFMLKTVGKPHSCPQKLRNKQATSKWIANTFLERFRLNPNWDVKQMIVELNVNHALEVSYKKCFRAKWIAKSMLEGTLEDEYKKIRPYIAELKKVDPEGRFLVEVDINGNEDKVFFQRFFVGFSSLIKGFLAGCRPVLGLDGCFLKGEIKGMLLCGWKRW
ncbi:hypothetical protein LINPERHAP2_LOCUS35801 [Linum perenne]